MKQFKFAGIGSRDTPQDIQGTMYGLGVALGEAGWLLRSGHADGADIAFEMGCLEANGKMEIFLPKAGFNGAPRNHPAYIVPALTSDLYDLAEEMHPAWEYCSSDARLFHMRNGCQVLGLNLDDPVDAVVCWTKDGKGGGGTGQAIRIAKSRNIPIFDIAIPGKLEEFMNFVNILENES